MSAAYFPYHSETNTTDTVPYGRKRTCWKKNYSTDDGKTLESGVITCAVCNIQRFYKFIKQTKKFGLPTCEPCRKFISSMIVNVRHGEQLSLVCRTKGPQNCLLLETYDFKNSASKSKKDSLSNVRCKSCWLSMCIQKYNMPDDLKNSLTKFISDGNRSVYPPNNVNNCFGEVDFDQLMKRRSQNVDEDNVCLKSLCRSYLRDSGLIARTNVSKNKTIYLRIRY